MKQTNLNWHATGLILTAEPQETARGSKMANWFSTRLSCDAAPLVAVLPELVSPAPREPESSLEWNDPGLVLAHSHLSSVLQLTSGIWGFVFSEALRCHNWGIVGSKVCTGGRAQDKPAALTPLPFSHSFSVTWVSTDATMPMPGAWNPSSCERQFSSLYRAKCLSSLFLKHHPLQSRLIFITSKGPPEAIKLLSSCLFLLPPPPLKPSVLLTLPFPKFFPAAWLHSSPPLCLLPSWSAGSVVSSTLPGSDLRC